MKSQIRSLLWVAVFLGVLALAEAGSRSKSSDSTLHTASSRHGLDPSNFVVVLIAAVILIYGSQRALRPPYVGMDGVGAEGYEEMQEAGDIAIHALIPGDALHGGPTDNCKSHPGDYCDAQELPTHFRDPLWAPLKLSSQLERIHIMKTVLLMRLPCLPQERCACTQHSCS
jgi:hypothetical protein